MEQSNKCSCFHHKIVPLGITLIGLVTLLGATGTLSSDTVSITWPIILLVIGLTKLIGCKCC